MTGADPRWHQEWAAALDRLEMDVARAEEMLRSPELAAAHTPPPWQPPSIPGPMPSDLVGRAQLILQRQQDTMRQMSVAVASAGRQQALTEKVAQTREHARPVYLDVTA